MTPIGDPAFMSAEVSRRSVQYASWHLRGAPVVAGRSLSSGMSCTGNGELQVARLSHEQPSSTWDEPEPAAVVAVPRGLDVRLTFEPGNVWRIGLVALWVVALGAFLCVCVGTDGGAANNHPAHPEGPGARGWNRPS